MSGGTMVSARHIVIDGAFERSSIYPGTTHTFKVTIPEQYDGTTPAALYVGLDGILCNAPEVIDTLTESGTLPVMIGVFLQPGYVKDSSGNIVRHNRSNEFDATDARFATFLEQELLPYIESMTTGDGRRISFTKNPADRMIFGLSSGGIAAFTAAWHRPDLFGKVYSGCGTFVAMRGGNDLQAIVRKSEPKPLRIFLQDGFDDVWNGIFGHWFEANTLLASALVFSGHDLMTDWREGVHSVRRTSEIFPDVMKWMWRDGSKEIKPGTTQNDFLNPLLIAGEKWEETDESLPAGNTVAVYPDGKLRAVADNSEPTNYLYQELSGNNGEWSDRQRFYWLHTLENSKAEVRDMKYDNGGNLWVLTSEGIQICDQNGRVRGILTLPSSQADRMRINDGSVSVGTPDGKTLERKFNVKPAVKGTTPPSQGQA